MSHRKAEPLLGGELKEDSPLVAVESTSELENDMLASQSRALQTLSFCSPWLTRAQLLTLCREGFVHVIASGNRNGNARALPKTLKNRLRWLLGS